MFAASTVDIGTRAEMLLLLSALLLIGSSNAGTERAYWQGYYDYHVGGRQYETTPDREVGVSDGGTGYDYDATTGRAVNTSLPCGNGTDEYDPATSLCCNGIVRARRCALLDCCGYILYDTAVDLCCDNGSVIVPKVGASWECCGRQAYDANNEICCDGAIHRDDCKSLSCCGTDVYDPQNHRCCYNRYLVPKYHSCYY